MRKIIPIDRPLITRSEQEEMNKVIKPAIYRLPVEEWKRIFPSDPYPPNGDDIA